MGKADHETLRRLAEAVRQCCLTEAQKAFEQGGLSGLCSEGRWELAMDRLRSFDLEPIVRSTLAADPPS